VPPTTTWFLSVTLTSGDLSDPLSSRLGRPEAAARPRSSGDPGRAGGGGRATLAVVPSHRLRLEGPAALALEVVTSLADADGVELVSSAQPSALDGGRVALDVTVDGERDRVADVAASIRGRLPTGASIEFTGA
jgi:hypothetical protein